MNTPIYDFVEAYRRSDTVRLHMPGHKGRCRLGCEDRDLTEVHGADALYEADGIIAVSEANASHLFGSGRTLYSTEGSTQCIKAMLCLAAQLSGRERPLFLAARNVHKAFLYAAALLDADVQWLSGENKGSLCRCSVGAQALEAALAALPAAPAGVYLTSPDYLGGMANVRPLAEVCHRYGTLLLIDNAHGAYLHFLEEPCHPMDLGADICCDSAHKTLPVLTGGAYLHLSHQLQGVSMTTAKAAMAINGSTSPSYLTLASLDLCNRLLAETYPRNLAECIRQIAHVKAELTAAGWTVLPSDPLRITIAAPLSRSGRELAGQLRSRGLECEFADGEHLVMMLTPDNSRADLQRICSSLGRCSEPPRPEPSWLLPEGEQVMSIRRAVLAPQETVPVREAAGRICASPAVSCPPAIPIVISGQRISRQAAECMLAYGITSVQAVI